MRLARDLVLSATSLVLASLALASCSGGGSSSSSGGQPAAGLGGGTSAGTTSGGQGAGAQPPAGAWLKGDFHVHSQWSGDATAYGDDVATVIRCAERAGLDFTTISDHRTVAVLTDPQFTGTATRLVLIPGEEWGGPGHAGAHGLTRAPVYLTQDQSVSPQDAVAKIQAAIDDIHAMGGIFILNHPVDDKTPWLWPVDRFDGVEVFNQPWAFRDVYEMSAADVANYMSGHQMAGLTVTAEMQAAVAVTGAGLNGQRLKLYEGFLSSGHHIAAMGGGDAHYLVLPGNPTTEVFAAQATPQGIIDGVKKGRTQVLRRAQDAPALEFAADRDGDGVFETIVGDSIPLGLGPITFRIHAIGAAGGKIDLVRNGATVQEWQVPAGASDFMVTYQDRPSARTWYRVNCWERIDMSGPSASLLRDLVLGKSSMGWLQSLLTGSMASWFGGALGRLGNDIQSIIDQGGPAGLWLLFFGGQAGVQFSPVATQYPRLEFPKGVSQILNACPNDPDFCPGVLTSPIWVE